MKYSPLELDQMRRAIYQAEHHRLLAWGADVYATVKDDQIERILLTHMMNETTPDEVEKYAKEMEVQHDRGWKWRTAEVEATQRFCQHVFVKRSYGLQCKVCELHDRRLKDRK